MVDLRLFVICYAQVHLLDTCVANTPARRHQDANDFLSKVKHLLVSEWLMPPALI